MKTIYTAAVEVISGRDGSVRSDDGLLEARLAFQKALGGSGQGTNPEQLLAAGWGACFASSLAYVAREEGKPLGSIAVNAEVDLLQGSTGFALKARLTVNAPGETPARVERLIEQARQVCPYSKALKATVEADYRVGR
ncbi:MAG: Ohr family peroxiredoxin [Myxococcaceae bacterium]|nr:Ohr family peroxiredoxin [Myxococcaceae bacterium]